MENNPPTWLKSMHNGTVGESRTKTFLIDRFWILERSVDVDGADFLIQKRITNAGLYNTKPLSLGIVQSKFYGTTATTQYVPVKYITNEKNEPFKEFFLICHTGDEDNRKVYLLTAKDVIANFKITDEKYVLGGSSVLVKKFEVTQPSAALSRIESALDTADFKSNRTYFASNYGYTMPDIEIIDSDYKIPINNGTVNIQEQLYSLKKNAYACVRNAEEIISRLNEIISTDDPHKALEALDDIVREYGRRLPIASDWGNNNLDDRYLQDALDEHDPKLKFLREKGLLDNYTKTHDEIFKKVTLDLEATSETVNKNQYFQVTAEINLDSLILISLDTQLLTTMPKQSIAQTGDVLKISKHMKLEPGINTKKWEALIGRIKRQLPPWVTDESLKEIMPKEDEDNNED